MTREQIKKALADSVGNPTSGAVAESLDVMADAVDAALNPKPKTEKRVVQPEETR